MLKLFYKFDKYWERSIYSGILTVDQNYYLDFIPIGDFINRKVKKYQYGDPVYKMAQKLRQTQPHSLVSGLRSANQQKGKLDANYLAQLMFCAGKVERVKIYDQDLDNHGSLGMLETGFTGENDVKWRSIQ